ncbi:HAD-IA family hydrolase [Agrococcus jejuensis]|uniref:Sugar-phosphatase n=1 Tax=Agrococcus jejuensis TaxID=399736 RepID=A0A1G8GYQ6_9MICO|nr:HAD-IA family hydrolase [Agrococcus jejuensis]SDH99528.1 sugar-phosphatase [Agrococcus jejuensis]
MTDLTLRARALLLDLDGTLVDSTPAVDRSWATWAAEEGIEGFRIVEHGRPARDIVAEHVPADRVAASLARIVELEVGDTADVVALPGAVALVSSLPGSAWAIVTSGSEPLARGRIAAAGLPVPDVFVTSSLPIPGKPAPDPYLHAARALGLEPADCVVVEDAPAGLEAAAAAGMRAIGVVGTYPASRLSSAIAIVDAVAALDVTTSEDGWLTVRVAG